MRYRKLDANGDYTFGHGQQDFYINVPAAVGQSVLTRLKLWRGEWFLDTSEGTPWLEEVLSANIRNTVSLYDRAIRNRVSQTPGVTGIKNYSSSLDNVTRKLTVSMEIDTAYGSTLIQTVI